MSSIEFTCDCGYDGGLEETQYENIYICPSCKTTYEVEVEQPGFDPINEAETAPSFPAEHPQPVSPASEVERPGGFNINTGQSTGKKSNQGRPANPKRLEDRKRKKGRKSKEEKKLAEVPGWAWIFLVAVWLIPVVTLGGCGPFAIAAFSTTILVSLTQTYSLNTGTRIILSISTVVLAWVSLGALLVAISFATGGVKLEDFKPISPEVKRQAAKYAKPRSNPRRTSPATPPKPTIDPVAHLPKIPPIKTIELWKVPRHITLTLPQNGFVETGPTGSYLAGFRYSMTPNGDKVVAVQPIYRTADGSVVGKLYGQHVAKARDVIADDGYTIAGYTKTHRFGIQSVELTIAKSNGAQVDLEDTKPMVTLGRRGNTATHRDQSRRPFIGVCGEVSNGELSDITLIPSPDATPLRVAESEFGDSFDILQEIDLVNDVARGKWFSDNGVLQSQENSGMLHLPVVPPSEYQLRVVAERVSGDGCLMLGALKDGKHFHIAIDHRRGEWASLMNYDGHESRRENPTSVPGPFIETGAKTTFVFNITNDRIQAIVNDVAVIDFPADYRRLSPTPHWATKDNASMCLVHDHSVYRIHEISMRRITGDAPSIQGVFRELREIASSGPAGPRSESAGRKDGEEFISTAPDGMQFVGLRCAVADRKVVGIQAVFRSTDGDFVGPFFGKTSRTAVESIAPVGSHLKWLGICDKYRLRGIRPHFGSNDVNNNSLQPGAWLGESDAEELLGVGKQKYTGIYGRIHEGRVAEIGLVSSGKPTPLEVADSKIGPSYDLLRATVPAQMQISGVWNFVQNSLVSTENRGFIHLPIVPPTEYEITLEVEPLNDQGLMVFGGLMNGKRFHVILDENDWSGVDRISGHGVGKENESSSYAPVFKPRTKHQVIIRATQKRVQAIVDGIALVDWEADYTRVEANPFWRPKEPRALCLGFDRSPFRIHSMVFTKISGKMGRIRARTVKRPTPVGNQ